MLVHLDIPIYVFIATGENHMRKVRYYNLIIYSTEQNKVNQQFEN